MVSDMKKEEKSFNKKLFNFKISIRFGISAEFYPILMYHMSNSGKNWPSYEIFYEEELLDGQNAERRAPTATSWTTTRAARAGGGDGMG